MKFCQVLGKTFDQSFTIFRPRRTALFIFHNSSADLPVCGRKHGVQGPCCSMPRLLQKLRDARYQAAIVGNRYGNYRVRWRTPGFSLVPFVPHGTAPINNKATGVWGLWPHQETLGDSSQTLHWILANAVPSGNVILRNLQGDLEPPDIFEHPRKRDRPSLLRERKRPVPCMDNIDALQPEIVERGPQSTLKIETRHFKFQGSLPGGRKENSREG